MITCIAIDDEPLALALIRNFIEKVEEIKLVQIFTNIEEAALFLENQKVDLIFLDIEMPDMNGIEFYRTYASNEMLIFTTAYSAYAYEGFNLNALDYLLKPFDFERFQSACEKVIKVYKYKNEFKEKDVNFISIKSEYKIINLAIQKILYLESKDDYVKLHLADGKFIMSKITTKGILDKLPENVFIRIHRSYIVNKTHIKSISAHKLDLINIELPIGKKYKKDVLNSMST